MWINWRLSSNTCVRVIFYKYRNHSVNLAHFISTWFFPCLPVSQVFPPYNLHSVCFDNGDTTWHNFDKICVHVCRCVCLYTLCLYMFVLYMCAGVFVCTHLCLYLYISEDDLIFSQVCYTSLLLLDRFVCCQLYINSNWS